MASPEPDSQSENPKQDPNRSGKTLSGSPWLECNPNSLSLKTRTFSSGSSAVTLEHLPLSKCSLSNISLTTGPSSSSSKTTDFYSSSEFPSTPLFIEYSDPDSAVPGSAPACSFSMKYNSSLRPQMVGNDMGSKLIIIMVGLPARGKSYIAKQLARYLNWLQHETRIFNVGERRRFVSMTLNARRRKSETCTGSSQPHIAPPDSSSAKAPQSFSGEHTAKFFDPDNKTAAHLREQAAMHTLDELLDYILYQNGSVAILDATNSTLARRHSVMKRIHEVAGPAINVLLVESVCNNQALLESNFRLKLFGPDYRGKDPVEALNDFKERVTNYERKYVPLGEDEERRQIPYVKMIDVGRQVITHRVKGFLASQAVYYLLNFNLASRGIWITPCGQSIHNFLGKIEGDPDQTQKGLEYARVLTDHIETQRDQWESRQYDKLALTHNCPLPGDSTPPGYHMNHRIPREFVRSSVGEEETQILQGRNGQTPSCQPAADLP